MRRRRYSLHKDSTKKCSSCGGFKNVAEFSWANKKKGYKQSSCRECEKTRNYVWYRKRRARIDDYLKTHPCVDCGESDYRVLEFDHVKGEKKFNISQEWTKPWETLKVEIAKCEIRCRSHHIIRHKKEGYGGGGGPKLKDIDTIEYRSKKDLEWKQPRLWGEEISPRSSKQSQLRLPDMTKEG